MEVISTPEPTTNIPPGRDILGLEAGDHVGHHRHRVRAVQTAGQHLHNRAVAGLDDRERRRVAFDEHQRGLLVTHRAPRGLRERTRRVQVGDEHDVVNATRDQSFAQPCGLVVVTPGDTGRAQPVPTGLRALLRAEDGRDHLLGRT